MKVKQDFFLLKVADGTEMQVYSAKPGDAVKNTPVLIVFQEAFGVNAHIRSVVDRFAAEGYFAISPELFHRTAPKGFSVEYTDMPVAMQHLQAMTEKGMKDDMTAVWEWMRSNHEISMDHIGAVGYCMGGRMAFFMNTLFPVKAAVSYYGGRIAPQLIMRADSIHAPMLFFWGGKDKHIPKEQVREVTERMTAANKEFISVEISYADHGFFCDTRASYNAQAASEAWPLTLAFLNTRLKK